MYLHTAVDYFVDALLCMIFVLPVTFRHSLNAGVSNRRVGSFRTISGTQEVISDIGQTK